MRRIVSLVIARNGKPAARLVPVEHAAVEARAGIARGRFPVPADIDSSHEVLRI